jgi:hypothetical protein
MRHGANKIKIGVWTESRGEGIALSNGDGKKKELCKFPSIASHKGAMPPKTK